MMSPITASTGAGTLGGLLAPAANSASATAGAMMSPIGAAAQAATPAAASMTTPQALGLLGAGMKMMGGNQQPAPAPMAIPQQQAPQPLPRRRTF